MINLPNEQQLFYKKDEFSPWDSSVNGIPWTKEKCKGYLYSCLTWDEFQAIVNPPQTLEECKSAKMAALKSQFDDEYSGGFNSNEVFYSSDDTNRYRITKAKANSGGLVMNSGNMVMLDAPKSLQVDIDMNAHLDDLDSRFYAAQNEVAAATTKEEVNEVVL